MGLGLKSAIYTASTGMKASEKTINVAGNNLANANTIGYKYERADFVDFLSYTYRLGTSPGMGFTAGTNPTQIGMGVSLAGVTINFTQGSFKEGMTNADIAINGNGFIIVEQPGKAVNAYTRNGALKLNSNLTLTTNTGEYVLGYGINDKFQIQYGALTHLRIPIGEMHIAEQTSVVNLEGVLNAIGDSATQGTVLQTPPMTDLSKSRPVAGNSTTITQLPRPGVEGFTDAIGTVGGGAVEAGDYLYRLVYVDVNGIESDFSAPITATVQGGEDSITLDNLPGIEPGYDALRIYRAVDPGNPTQTPVFSLVTDLAPGTTSYIDVASTASLVDPTRQLNQSRLGESHQYSYQYYVTYTDAFGNESVPVAVGNPSNIHNGQVILSGLPAVDPANNPDNWAGRKIYRNSGFDPTEIYLVGEIRNMDPDATFIDRMSDAVLIQQQTVSEAGRGDVLINQSTKLVDVGKFYQGQFVRAFDVGALTLSPQKGTQNLRMATLEITDDTTVGEYLLFLNEAFGIRNTTDGVPPDQGALGRTINGGSQGAAVMNGSLYLLGNAGVTNALTFDSNDMKLYTASGPSPRQIDLGWGQDPSNRQNAIGAGVKNDLQVYDSLGSPITVQMTFVLESKTDTETIYRWFADSSDHQPIDGTAIATGTGLIRFDQHGRLIGADTTTVSIERTQVASVSPLDFDFEVNIGALMALATVSPDVKQTYQDGAGAGTLYTFTIMQDGTIMGRFTSGAERPLGQIPLATFRNQEGLYKAGDSLWLAGTNSGDPIINIAGQGGVGSIRSHSLELSNTDMGAEIINMILASAMYRANAKVMTTSNEMFDALLRIV
ncbi:MAG: flagellar hook-basal body complex protein [Planctomycetaceae bacterium]|nr:flagellar hook-basal body complex protein [Planctomycetaceae bacterium]